MKDPLKLGFAVACFVGLAVLVVIHLKTDSKEDPAPVVVSRPDSAPGLAPAQAPVAIPVASTPQLGSRAPRPEAGTGTKDASKANARPAAEPGDRKGLMAKGATPEGAKSVTPGGAGTPSAPEPEAQRTIPEARSGTAKSYTVVQGDTLYGISIKVFGTPRHYERIYEENRDRIADPNTLQVGLNLKMPELPLKAKAGGSAMGVEGSPAPGVSTPSGAESSP